MTLIFKKIKSIADYHLKKIDPKFSGIKYTTITVPIDFRSEQRTLIKLSAMNSGFEKVSLYDEPLAATLAFQKLKYIENMDEDFNLMFDFGAGTLDMIIFSTKMGKVQLKCQAGDNNLGGVKFTEGIQKHIIKHIQNNIPKKKLNQNEKFKIYELAEKAKKILSKYNCTEFKLHTTLSIGKELEYSIQRKTFEEISENLFRQIGKAFENLFESCAGEVEESMISKIFLIGGTSQIPKVEEIVREYFESHDNMDIDIVKEHSIEAVALGAAIVSRDLLSNKKAAGKDEKLFPSMKLTKSLGIGTAMGNYKKLIEKGSEAPCEGAVELYLEDENQKLIELDVYQGENSILAYNDFLQTITIEINSTKKINDPFKFTFKYDSDRTLTITVNHESLGKEIKINNDKLKLTPQKFEKKDDL